MRELCSRLQAEEEDLRTQVLVSMRTEGELRQELRQVEAALQRRAEEVQEAMSVAEDQQQALQAARAAEASAREVVERVGARLGLSTEQLTALSLGDQGADLDLGAQDREELRKLRDVVKELRHSNTTFRNETDSFCDQVSEQAERIRQMEGERGRLEEELRSTQQRLVECEADLATDRQCRSKLEAQLVEAEETRRRLEVRLSATEELNGNFERANQSLHDQLEKMRAELDVNRTEVWGMKQQLLEYSHAFKGGPEGVHPVASDPEVRESEAVAKKDYEELQLRFQAAEGELARARSELQASAEVLAQAKSTVPVEVAALTEQVRLLAAEKDECLEAQQRSERDADDAKRRLKALEKRYTDESAAARGRLQEQEAAFDVEVTRLQQELDEAATSLRVKAKEVDLKQREIVKLTREVESYQQREVEVERVRDEEAGSSKQQMGLQAALRHEREARQSEQEEAAAEIGRCKTLLEDERRRQDALANSRARDLSRANTEVGELRNLLNEERQQHQEHLEQEAQARQGEVKRLNHLLKAEAQKVDKLRGELSQAVSDRGVEVSSLTRELEGERQKVGELTSTIQQQHAELLQLKSALDNAEERVKAANESLHRIRMQEFAEGSNSKALFERLTADLEAEQSKNHDLSTEMARQAALLADSERKIASLTTALEASQATEQELTRIHQQEMDRLRHELEHVRVEGQRRAESLQSALDTNRVSQREQEKMQEQLRVELREKEEELEGLQEVIQEKHRQVSRLEEKLGALRASYHDVLTASQSGAEAEGALQAEVERLRSYLATVEMERDQLMTDLAASREEAASLRTLEAAAQEAIRAKEDLRSAQDEHALAAGIGENKLRELAEEAQRLRGELQEAELREGCARDDLQRALDSQAAERAADQEAIMRLEAEGEAYRKSEAYLSAKVRQLEAQVDSLTRALAAATHGADLSSGPPPAPAPELQLSTVGGGAEEESSQGWPPDELSAPPDEGPDVASSKAISRILAAASSHAEGHDGAEAEELLSADLERARAAIEELGGERLDQMESHIEAVWRSTRDVLRLQEPDVAESEDLAQVVLDATSGSLQAIVGSANIEGEEKDRIVEQAMELVRVNMEDLRAIHLQEKRQLMEDLVRALEALKEWGIYNDRRSHHCRLLLLCQGRVLTDKYCSLLKRALYGGAWNRWRSAVGRQGKDAKSGSPQGGGGVF
jgi:chromosome segregation ATPase